MSLIISVVLLLKLETGNGISVMKHKPGDTLTIDFIMGEGESE